MYLTSEIVKDTLAARRFRLLAPLAVLLALVRRWHLAPGIIGADSSPTDMSAAIRRRSTARSMDGTASASAPDY